MPNPGFLFGRDGKILLCTNPPFGNIAAYFTTNGALMNANYTGDLSVTLSGYFQCLNLVPLFQGELLILLCHVVITKVVFAAIPFGATLRFGYAFASLRPEGDFNLLHLLLELRKL